MNTDFLLGYIFGFLTMALITVMLIIWQIRKLLEHILKILKGG